MVRWYMVFSNSRRVCWTMPPNSFPCAMYSNVVIAPQSGQFARTCPSLNSGFMKTCRLLIGNLLEMERPYSDKLLILLARPTGLEPVFPP